MNANNNNIRVIIAPFLIFFKICIVQYTPKDKNIERYAGDMTYEVNYSAVTKIFFTFTNKGAINKVLRKIDKIRRKYGN